MEISATATSHQGRSDLGGVTVNVESPAAGEKAVPPAGGEHDAGLAPEPEVTPIVPPATVSELMTRSGQQVTAAIDNPPAPVERPAELLARDAEERRRREMEW